MLLIRLTLKSSIARGIRPLRSTSSCRNELRLIELEGEVKNEDLPGLALPSNAEFESRSDSLRSSGKHANGSIVASCQIALQLS